MRALKMGAILAWGLAFQLQAAPPGQYTVARGDCLWAIAARADVYGDPWKWPLLYEANPALIQDPDLIEPGWRLNVPPSPGAQAVARARLFAQRYKEEPASAPSAPVPLLPEVAFVEGEEAAPPGAGPVDGWRIVGSALAALLLFLAGFAALSYRLMKRKAAAQAAPMPQPESAAPPAPVLKAEEAVPAVGQPTESEAILRAEDAPDPLHPEEGKQAA